MKEQLLDQLVALGPWNPMMLLLATGIFAVAIGTRFPRVLILAALACYAAMMANRSLLTLPGAIDLRLVGLALVVYMAMLRQRLPRFRVLRGGIFPATFAYLLLGFAFIGTAQSHDEAVQGLLGALATLLFAWVLLCASDEEELRSCIHGVTAVMVLGSIVLVVVDPGSAIVQGRWRGVTTNANSLGLMAGLYFLTSKRHYRAWTLAPVVLVLVGSASRAATFALGLVVGPRLIEGRSRRVRRAVTVAACVVAIPILHSVFFSQVDRSGGSGAEVNNSLARTSNSRIDEWREAIDIVKDNPVTGVGIGSQPDLVSSSVLSPLVEIGVPALLPLGLIVVLALRKANARESTFRPIFFFLFVNGVFEMWLFAGGSLTFLVFLLAASDPRPRDDGDDDDGEDEAGADGVDVLVDHEVSRPHGSRLP